MMICKFIVIVVVIICISSLLYVDAISLLLSRNKTTTTSTIAQEHRRTAGEFAQMFNRSSSSSSTANTTALIVTNSTATPQSVQQTSPATPVGGFARIFNLSSSTRTTITNIPSPTLIKPTSSPQSVQHLSRATPIGEFARMFNLSIPTSTTTSPVRPSTPPQTVQLPSPAPPVPTFAPLNTNNDDDWYYSYRGRMHSTTLSTRHNDTYAITDCDGRTNCTITTPRSGKMKSKRGGKGGMMKMMKKTKAPSSSFVPSEMPLHTPTTIPSTFSFTLDNSNVSEQPSTTMTPTFTSVPTLTAVPSTSFAPVSNIQTPLPVSRSPTTKAPILPPPTRIPSRKIPTAEPKKKTKSPVVPETIHPTAVTTIEPTPLMINEDLILDATPFSLTYTIDNSSVTTNITNEQIIKVQDITMRYLKDYINEQFFGNTDSIIDCYITKLIGNNTSMDNNITQHPYFITSFRIVFTESTTFIPSTQEIDILIESAFIIPFVEVLVSTLQELPFTNLFSTTTFIQYMERSDIISEQGGRSSPPISINITTNPPIQIDDSNNNSDNEITSPPVKIDDNQETSPPVKIEDSDYQGFDMLLPQYEGSTVKVTPFVLTYTRGNNTGGVNDLNPTIGEIRTVANMTFVYLDSYLHRIFNLASQDTYTKITGYSAGLIQQHNVIEYRAGLYFSNTSIFTSIQREVDMTIETAFTQHYAESLILSLRSNLPQSNPFSKTLAITLEFKPSEENHSGISAIGIGAIVAASVLSVILIVSFTMYFRYRIVKQQRQRRRKQAINTIPKIIIHTNHDSIHGDLIEIISSPDDDDDDDVNDNDNDTISSVLSSIRKSLIDPLTSTHQDEMTDSINIGEASIFKDNTNSSSSGSLPYRMLRRPTTSNTRTVYSSDGWSSTTSSSTSALSIPMKYTEPTIFEHVD